jgi:hypothetical protein
VTAPFEDICHRAIPSRQHAGVTDYRRNFTAGCGFFFERPQDVQQGDGFRKSSTHPEGLLI